MPSNVEIKAKVCDMKVFMHKASEIADSPENVIDQEDVFFIVPKGRLKLRMLKQHSSHNEADHEQAQLIYYERSDETGPKSSDYHVTPIQDPHSLKDTLGRALGIRGIVKKRRVLYMVGQTRVHADSVADLGDFMELEIVMKENQSTAEGQKIAEDLMAKLGIEEGDLISCAYMDLILAKNQNVA